MGESLMVRRRVGEEGLRIVNPCHVGARRKFDSTTPLNQTEDFVCKALEHYNNFLRKRAERDTR